MHTNLSKLDKFDKSGITRTTITIAITSILKSFLIGSLHFDTGTVKRMEVFPWLLR